MSIPEFRRGPASPNAEICIIWTDFATNFVQAAIEIGDALDPKEYTYVLPPLHTYDVYRG